MTLRPFAMSPARTSGLRAAVNLHNFMEAVAYDKPLSPTTLSRSNTLSRSK